MTMSSSDTTSATMFDGSNMASAPMIYGNSATSSTITDDSNTTSSAMIDSSSTTSNNNNNSVAVDASGMSGVPTASGVKREGCHLSNEEKLRLCTFSQENPTLSQKDLSSWALRTFGLDKPPCQATISNILKKRTLLQSMNAAELSCKRRRVLKYPELDRALGHWVLYCLHKGLHVSGERIKKQAVAFADLLYPPNTVEMAFSNGWLEGFQTRYGIKKLKKAAPPPQSQQQQQLQLQPLQQQSQQQQQPPYEFVRIGNMLGSVAVLQPAFVAPPPLPMDLATPSSDVYTLTDLQLLVAALDPRDVYHMDEVGLFYDMALDQQLWLAQRSAAAAAAMSTTPTTTPTTTPPTALPARLTIVLAVNADASDFVEPLFVGKVRRPTCFGDKLAAERGFQYDHNRVGLMSSQLFQRWLRAFDSRMRAERRSVVLVIDSAPSHVIVGVELTNVRVAFLAVKGAVKLHPLNGGIAKAFKRRYRHAQLVHALDQQEQGMRCIFAASQLEAMQWSKQSWHNVAPELVQLCWRNTKIFGHDGVTPVEKRRLKSEDDIDDDIHKHIQWLQIADPMPLDEMLSPDGENDVHAGVALEDFVNCAIEVDVEPDDSAGGGGSGGAAASDAMTMTVADSVGDDSAFYPPPLPPQQLQPLLFDPPEVDVDTDDAAPLTHEQKLEHLSHTIRILRDHDALESTQHELRRVQREIRDVIVEQRRNSRR